MLAICPGSFDPVTNGHLDIIERAAKVFGKVIIAVSPNPLKAALFTVEERIEMLREVCSKWPNVEVDSFTGLLVKYAKSRGANVIVKGLRAVSDFEVEFQMALMNRQQEPSIETIFMMTGAEYSYLSSSIVKEVASLGGSVEGLIPEAVLSRLVERIQGKGRGIAR